MAQLVEHNLAKVGVAGSSPVVRSKHNSPTTTVAGLFRTHCRGSNPRGSERLGAWLWRCLPRISALGVSSWASRKTSLQGRRARWLQKSPLRAHGCPMPRSIRSTRARLRIRSAQSFIQPAPLVQSRSCRRPWIARARPLYLPRWSRRTWRAASHQLECQLWRPRLDACCGRSVVAAYVYARAAGL